MPKEQYLFHQYRQYPGNFSREGSRPHQHPFWQLEYITGGVGIFYCNNLNWQFGEGDVIIIPPCNPHNFEYHGHWHEMELFVAVPANAWQDVVGIDCQLEFDTKRQDSSIFYDDFTVEEITTAIPGLLPDILI